MINEQLNPKVNKHELGVTLQVGEEGISTDYKNEYMFAIMGCKALLNRPGFEVNEYADSETELRLKIFKKIKDLHSYTEYMDLKGKFSGIGLADFLTSRGKEIVNRLDQIALELKGLQVEDPQILNVDRALELLEEGRGLVVG